MKVVGISPLDKDATVSIVEDGEIRFAAGEERYSRTKQQDGFPHRALEAGLAYTSISPEEIDLVAYPFLSWEREAHLFNGNVREEKALLNSAKNNGLAELLDRARDKVPERTGSIHGLKDLNERMEKSALHEAAYSLAGGTGSLWKMASIRASSQWARVATASFKKWQYELEEGLHRLGWQSKLKRMDHHLSHAANAFLASGFNRTLIVTLDGYGSGLAGSVFRGDGGRIERLHGVRFPHSLGSMYEQVTSALGFKPGRHEGKIVGLAAYGDPSILREVLLNRIEQTPGDFRILGANNVYFSRDLAAHFPKIDVAAAYQHVLEEVATNFVRHWVRRTGIDTIVLSGGVTANVKLNQRIFEIDGVNNIFVYPNMGDGGCGTGAALFHSWPGGTREGIRSAYFGASFSEREMQRALDSATLEYTRPEHLAGEIAHLIHQGSVVARFDGRMEYGPRALGNRSILYHGREPEVNQWLNRRLGRTEFMPFAPVTLYEARHRCYHNVRGAEHSAEFMTITFDCTEEMKSQCPAAVHVDGTARPQLIRREVNPGYYDILSEYQKLSGIPSLINTSFNMHEEPIVCSPKDAVRAFVQGDLDYLNMGPFIARNPSACDGEGQPRR